MPSIRPNSDLRNSYNQISEYCHTCSEPVYITKNGKDNLVVLDIESYDQFVDRFELNTLLVQGLENVQQKNYKIADGKYKLPVRIEILTGFCYL
ncbi:MAG: prevent-host-death family protein [Lachnospiraceae bacterium]|jgi:PHD/YefM family antitoxin component YafN of YafNO toxin-antitoxin module|nr:prevent-host-death family protein [Lachnospiraceae bacterium]